MRELPHYHESMLTWLGALSVYDSETAMHSSRVAQEARELARWVGLEGDDVENAGYVGLLHDVGKLIVPLTILTKPGPLTVVEWGQMQRHAANGADLVGSLSASLEPIADGVRTHHERWDGHGYPDGVSGEDIPLLGRIVAIVDVFDAVTHPRCYREGVFTTEEALLEIEAESGSQFDPALAATFVRGMIERGPEGSARDHRIGAASTWRR